MRSTDRHLAKWVSPLLLSVLTLLLFESLSGFLLFFFGRFIPGETNLISVHWIVGLLALIPYGIYQWRHYFSVKQYKSQLHYRIGLFSFFLILVVIASGIPLIFDLNSNNSLYVVIDLIHVVSSFAFLILLCGHLVLVARITTSRVNKKVPVSAGTFSMIGRKVLWIPLMISIFTLILISLLH